MSNAGERTAGRNGIQVIGRAADILRALKVNADAMSLGQIAERVSLPRSTVQRIVGALQEENFVVAEKGSSGFKLGPELSALASATRYNTVEECRLLLTELSQATGETTDLSALKGGGMMFLDQISGTHRLRTVSAVGDVFPLTTTANGRAALSLMPEERAQMLIAQEWERRGIEGDMNAFMMMIAEIRKTGLAYDLDEHAQGISAVGFAFSDWSGSLHAISVPVPSTRFEACRHEVEVEILKTAGHIKQMMKSSSV